MRRTITTPAALAMLSQPTLSAARALEEANVKLIEAHDTVKVSTIPGGIDLRSVNDPEDIIWERLPEYRVAMSPAPAVHQSVALRVNYDTEES